MYSKLEKVEDNIATLEISVSSEKLEEGLMKSYLKNVKKFNIAGFRKGKAPRKIIERHYGEAVFYEDAINIVCPELYDEAVKEHNLKPVDRPDIDIVEIESGKGMVFKAVVTVKPEVVLGQYKGIEAEKKEYNVTDEDVNKEIEVMREQNARLIEVTDRPVKNGDITIIDFKGFVDGNQFEGGTAENYRLEIGSGQFIPGFEDQLIGAELGKEIDIDVKFPEEYKNKELAGKPALFKVTVKEVKEKQLTEIDDEFAKDVSEFDTLEELKAEIRKKGEEHAKRLENQQYEDKIINKVVENATVDIPEVMINTQVNIMLRDFDYQLRYQGLNLEAYLEYAKMDIDKLKETYWDTAKGRVKSQLVLEKIAENEGIAATEEDLNTEIEKTAKRYEQDLEKFKKTLKEDEVTYIKDGIMIQKAIDFLVENSVAK
ncbi:MAG TPA: trigger factor [Bacillota bacterium]|nr:trigger factor [Bacillota bacterium]HPL53106.1 trigger factor [Bacillota bacterium]